MRLNIWELKAPLWSAFLDFGHSWSVIMSLQAGRLLVYLLVSWLTVCQGMIVSDIPVSLYDNVWMLHNYPYARGTVWMLHNYPHARGTVWKCMIVTQLSELSCHWMSRYDCYIVTYIRCQCMRRYDCFIVTHILMPLCDKSWLSDIYQHSRIAVQQCMNVSYQHSHVTGCQACDCQGKIVRKLLTLLCHCIFRCHLMKPIVYRNISVFIVVWNLLELYW